MKLSRKIHLYSSVLFIILFCVASVVIYFAFSRMSLQLELHRLEAEAVQASKELQQHSDRLTIEELLRAYVPIHGLIALVVEGNQPPIVVTSLTEARLGQLELVFSSSAQANRINIGDQSYSYVSVPFIEANGQVANLQMMVNLSELMSLLQLLRIVLIVVAICVMVPAVISSRLLGEIVMQPIKAMTRTMREVSKSGSFVRLKQVEQSKDELYEMGQTFNEMIDLLETNYNRQEQFVANASHELKTPITVIESYASLIKRRGKQQPEIIEESIEAIHSEAVRMKAMTEQLLLLAKPSRQWKVHKQKLDIVPLVVKTVEHFKNAYGREILISLMVSDSTHTSVAPEAVNTQALAGTISSDIEVGSNAEKPSIFVLTDGEKVSQLLNILLDNARKYSEALIEVQVAKQEGNCFIRVIDSGIGIPRQELEQVFERFYRVDKARTRSEHDDQVSVGLGLSLAQEIAEAIDVRIKLDSVEGSGTTATIFFQNVSQ